MVLMLQQACEMSAIIGINLGIVVPAITNHSHAIIGGVNVDATTEIIKGKYIKIMTKIVLGKEESKKIVFDIGELL